MGNHINSNDPCLLLVESPYKDVRRSSENMTRDLPVELYLLIFRHAMKLRQASGFRFFHQVSRNARRACLMSQDYLVLLVAGLLAARMEQEVSRSKAVMSERSWVRAFTTKIVNMFGPVTTDHQETVDFQVKASGFAVLILTAHICGQSCIRLSIKPESSSNLDTYSSRVPCSLAEATDADVLNKLLEERSRFQIEEASPENTKHGVTTKHGLVAGAVELVKAAASVAFPWSPCNVLYVCNNGEERPPYQFALSTTVQCWMDEKTLILPVQDVEPIHDAVKAFSFSSWTASYAPCIG